MTPTRRIVWLCRGKTPIRYFRNLAENTKLDSYVQDIRRLRGLPALADAGALLGQLDLDRELRIYLARKRSTNLLARHPWTAGLFERIARWRAIRMYLKFIAYFRRHEPRAVGIWGGMRFPETLVIRAAAVHGVPVLRFELGMLPHTRVIDARGVNYENSVPRDPDFYRSLPPAPPLAPATLLRRPRNPVKAASATVELPRRYLLVPFQVALDTQILGFSPWIPDMRSLFDVVVEAREKLVQRHPELSDLHLVFKEHPTCPCEYPDLHDRARTQKILFANDNSTQELIESAEAVLTINSTVGIEGLLLGKKVIVLGQAFYDLEGITRHARSREELLEVLESLASWQPDQDLTRRFLNYLAKDYCVPRHPGRPEDFLSADHDDWAADEARIRRILSDIESAG
jgi:capsular polysaccharide export protein